MSRSSMTVVAGAGFTTMQRSFGPGGKLGSGVQSSASVTVPDWPTPMNLTVRPEEYTSPTSSAVTAPARADVFAADRAGGVLRSRAVPAPAAIAAGKHHGAPQSPGA